MEFFLALKLSRRWVKLVNSCANSCYARKLTNVGLDWIS